MKKKRLYNGITYPFKECFCSNILIWLSLIWVAAFLCCFFGKLNGIHNKNGLFLIWCKLVKFTFTFLRKFRLCWLYKIKVSRCSCIFSFVWNFKSAIKSVSFLEKSEFRFVSEQKGQFSSSVTTAGESFHAIHTEKNQQYWLFLHFIFCVVWVFVSSSNEWFQKVAAPLMCLVWKG